MRFSFDAQSLDGKLFTLSDNDKQLNRAFVFLTTTCPIANSYIVELNRLHKALPKNVELFGVVYEPNTTRLSVSKHFTEYKAEFPILFDASGLLTGVLKPSHVPEAFVTSSTGDVVYRGAIDNAYEAIGRRRANVESHYLEDAIKAVAANEKPVVGQTKPVGCVLPPDRVNVLESNVTYARDIAPILQQRCENCHRPGQVAPFSLTNYEEAKSHAEMILEVTGQRIMPPWIPGPETEHRFVGQRWLSDRELKLLTDWVRAGCMLGDVADLPPPATFSEGWQLGTPDLVVKMQEPFTVPANGPDVLQNFVLPIDIPEDKLVAAVEFHPGNNRVVHHAVLFLDDKGQARKLDAATPEPGYGNFGGPGFLPSGALGGWSVGNTARRLPNDMGRYLKKGSDLVVQVHYHPTGKTEVDQSEIGIYFVNKPVADSLRESAKLVGSIWMANYEMDIPAGEANYRRSTSYTLPKDVIMVGIVPHMHLLGKSMRVTAIEPEKQPQVLIDIPTWNYNWQDEYYYERPIQLKAGTKLVVEAVFDNSAANPSNPSSPPKRVTWGEETTDEMLFCFFLLTANKTEDLIHTIFDNLGHDLKQNRKDVKQSP
ncbi:MAG: redoxin domain-containing protein [Planctomycetaceae bacterium]|nr:redoxin domain-containing protein [Planctomycetaceae bacterium]